uniref:Ig-like domain-containing protein n=1 Tax=Marmota marmota marmota TaxID=9994 RepID=A0A8C6EXE8_MARMA
PHPTALLTIEPVPFDAAEGRDVLLLVHNVSENAIGYNWFKGNTANNSFKIISYLVSSQMTTPGPAFNGGEKIYSNGSLLLQKVTQNDTGFYTLQTVTADAIVELATGEFFVHDSHFRPGTNLNLSCHADSNPPAQYSWSFNGRLLESTQQLSVPNLSTNNSGSYVCVAHNSVTNFNRTTTKNITVSGLVAQPSLRATNTEPHSVAMTCLSDDPGISITWIFNSQTLQLTDRMQLSPDHRTLSIDPVRQEDAGEYQCEASNPASSTRSDRYRLAVIYGPDAPIIKPPDSHFRPGTNLNLSCHADSNPPAQYSWSFNGRLLESTQQLSVPNLSTNNSGSYVCVAHNSVTNFNRTTTKNITVSAEERTPGLPVGAVAGIVTGVLVGVALVAALGCFLLHTRTGRYPGFPHLIPPR